MSEEAEFITEFIAHYSDIDVNGHINSVKYIDHMMDIFPLEWYSEHTIHRFEVAYVAEAHCGDRIRVYRHTEDGLSHMIRLSKVNADGSEHEICRGLAAFI